MDPNAMLPLAGVSLAIVGLATIPGSLAIGAQIRNRTPKDNFYEDEDGKATPESLAAFSQKRAKATVLLLAILGFELSLTVSILTTLSRASETSLLANWITTGSWTLILVQAYYIAAHHSPVKSHDLGIWVIVSCAFTAAAILPQALDAGLRQSRHKYDTPALVLRIIDCVVVILLGLASVLIPRRPAVFHNGGEVYRQFTVSVFNRVTWTWCRPLLNLATKKGDLDAKDLPQGDHEIRSDLLVKEWDKFEFTGSLAKSLLWAYKSHIALQWSVTLFRSFLGLGPFFVMRQILLKLEQRTNGAPADATLWLLAACLGLLTLAEQWIDGWTNWFSISRLAFPIRGQLSALIFEKSLRRKNVKSADAKDGAEDKNDDASKKDDKKKDGKKADGKNKDDKNKDDKKADGKKDDKSDDSVLKSRQAIVNLVGVDSRRIGGFAMLQFMIFGSFCKLILYSAYLINLLGWLPFGAGILAWSLVLPINTYASKYYMRASESLMKTRDEKLAVVNEALLGMRQIKFSALEKQWEQRILEMREKELKQIIRVFIGDTILFTCWVVSPILLAAVSIATYATIHKTLTPSVAFVSIGVFKALELALGALPEFISMGIDTLVSVRRVDTYLKGPEIKKTLTDAQDIAFDNASIAWPVDDEVPDKDRFILNKIDLSFPPGELSVVSGKTGSGKSLLLSALLGEADLLEGSIRMPAPLSPMDRNDAQAHPGNWLLPGSVAYVSQTPWLESTTFRENILFGLPLIQDRYDSVLEVCALKKDLGILTDGDKTELGANGINLSGGQKWRVTLARAVYSRADTLIMDDIFSAVDAHVGRQIFDKCVTGDLCKGRTRILVTHHVGLVQAKAKYLVELGEGSVMHCGLTSELAEDGTLQKIKSHEQPSLEDETGESSTAVNSEEASVSGAAEGDDNKADEIVNPLHKVASKEGQAGKKFIEDEDRAKGVVKSRIYATYLKDSGGYIFWTVCLFIYLAFEAGDLGRNWWLRIWTGQRKEAVVASFHSRNEASVFSFAFPSQQTLYQAAATQTPMVTAAGHGPTHTLSFYLWIYVALAFATGFVGTLRIMWTFYLSLKASRILFQRILHTVLRTPLRWLDTVPVGRILNRLTSDFDTIDNRLAMDISSLFWNVLAMVGICVASILVTVWILPVTFLLVCVAALIAKKYMDGARPMKRLESTAKSPVFEIFNAALAGMSTLRAYQKSGVYVDRMYGHIDSWNIVSVHMWLMNRWMGFRMAVLGALFTTAVGAIVVGLPFVDAALGGFTLAFALDFAGEILWSIRNYASLELDMNAAERVIEYCELKTESEEGKEPAAAWPTSGNVEVEDLVIGYADDLPEVLKGISFHVGNNERVGVVGRTGAGKSSLTLALFRFLEARSGKITIDGLDISKVDLHSLRSRLAIIPQDPVLFSGTVRSNLDPFNDRTDEELRESLARVHLMDSQPATPANEPASAANSVLAPKNANIFKDLNSGISESGGNLSQGQRQLLCLARAIVARPKIMVLDEATSAVDMATDSLIQRSIREEFTDSTLIVIAHRLSTIADFDRILVLSDGAVAEFGTPRELWDLEGSVFRDMCESSGEKDKLRAIVMGE